MLSWNCLIKTGCIVAGEESTRLVLRNFRVRTRCTRDDAVRKKKKKRKGKTKRLWRRAFTDIVCGTRAILKTRQEVVVGQCEIRPEDEGEEFDGTLKWHVKQRPVRAVR